MVKRLDGYMRGRKLQVKVEYKTSTKKAIEAGVHQGTMLSPQLFSIYTLDIPKTKNINLSPYANATAIAARSVKLDMATRYLPRVLDRARMECQMANSN